MKPEIVVRADGGPGIGLGHIRRCRALAAALKKSGRVTVSFASQTPEAVKQWADGKFTVRRIPRMPLSREPAWWGEAFRRTKPALVILDRYDLTPGYFKALRRTGMPVVLMDDEGRMKSYPLDGIINYNVHASRLSYPRDMVRFLGPRYALVGEEFLRARVRRRTTKFCRNVFAGLGGFAPVFLKQRVNASLKKLGFHVLQMEGRTSSVAAFLARADLAVSASGVTSYELACLGVPSILVVVAQNQAGIADEMARQKAAVSLGWLKDLKPGQLEKTVKNLAGNAKQRARLSRNARRLVDGRGPERTARALIKHFIGGKS